MEALTTLINVDVEMAPKLVSFIASAIDNAEQSNAFRTTCSEMIHSSQTEALIRKILDHTEDIIHYENFSDAEGCFQALVSILFSIKDQQRSSAIVISMAQAICANKSIPKLRLQILVTLFNLMTSSKEKFEIVKALLKYGSENGLSSVVGQLSGKVDGWIKQWNLSVEDERYLLRLFVDILSNNNEELQARRFLVRFLHTYGSEEFPADVLDIAIKAALAGVTSPPSAIADRNVVLDGLSKQRNNSPDLTLLVGQLRIFVSGTLADHKSYVAVNAAGLQRLGVDNERSLHTMRLMTLCAALMGRQKVHYTDIATALDVDAADVEEWVVEAISEGLIEGSLDQVNCVVSISRCFHGSFGKDQWEQIHTKLLDWRRSVNTVLGAMKAHDSADFA